LRIVAARLLRQRNGPLAQAFEDEIIKRTARGEIDRRLDAIAGVTGANADPNGFCT